MEVLLCDPRLEAESPVVKLLSREMEHRNTTKETQFLAGPLGLLLDQKRTGRVTTALQKIVGTKTADIMALKDLHRDGLEKPEIKFLRSQVDIRERLRAQKVRLQALDFAAQLRRDKLLAARIASKVAIANASDERAKAVARAEETGFKSAQLGVKEASRAATDSANRARIAEAEQARLIAELQAVLLRESSALEKLKQAQT